MGSVFSHRYDLIILAIAFLIYLVYWSDITLERFYSLNSSVYDLGSSMEVMWLIYNAHWTVSSFLYTFFIQGGKFILLPLAIPQNFQVLLIAQTFYIDVAVFAIYGISRHLIHQKTPSMLFSLSYLIFFPSAGLNWFDFHFQVLFVPLFLFAYYCYITNRFKISTALFILSGLTRFPLIIFPILFSLFVLAGELHNLKFNKLHYSVKRAHFAIVILSLALLILGASYYFVKFSGTGSVIDHLPVNNSSLFDINTLFYNLDDKIFTLLLLFAPLVGLPLLSRRWFLFLLPSIYLVLFSPLSVWNYPYLFQLQYTAPIIPFLFLGAIDAMASLFSSRQVFSDRGNDTTNQHISLPNREKMELFDVATLILILTTLLGTAYLPYGPLNDHVVMNYGLSEHTEVNWTRYNELENMIKLIPSDNKYVIYQDNIPQVLPRPTFNPSNPNLLVAGFNIPQNFTISGQNGKWISITPDYILADPYNSWLYSSLGPYNFSMYDIVHELYASGHYGILSEATGMILLEKNYAGPVKYFTPFSNYYPATMFLTFSGSGSRLVGGTIVVNNNPYYAWYGPYVYISPGKYIVNYEMKVTNNSGNNWMNLNVVSNDGNIINHHITGNNFTRVNHWTNISTTIYVNNTLANVQFRGDNTHWNGTIYFRGVTINEISPPATMFMAGYASNYYPATMFLMFSGSGSHLADGAYSDNATLES